MSKLLHGKRDSESPVVVLVCFPFSIHAARWANLFRASTFRIVVFPSVIQPRCPEFEPFHEITSLKQVDDLMPGEIGVISGNLVDVVADSAEDRLRGYKPIRSYAEAVPETTPSPASLVKLIKAIRPTLVHSLELQHGGYLCLEARRRMDSDFPRWLASSWGSDIFLYRKLPEHVPVLRELFQNIDALHSDCARDFDLAAELGFHGHRFPVVPAAGGADLSGYPDPASLPLPSKRNVILVKGNHGWSGRGINILMALHRVAPAIKRYRIRVSHSGSAVQRSVEMLAREDGLDIGLDPYYPYHSSAIERLAAARFVVATGVSDGIGTTLLEAMAVGTFCIQGNTSCACEWVTPGRTALITSPHDVAALGAAITKAATDDALVDDAVAINRKTIVQRWSAEVVKPIVIEGYENLISSAREQKLA
jgi:glycosyltransferase involved in cell wall biosynthesis